MYVILLLLKQKRTHSLVPLLRDSLRTNEVWRIQLTRDTEFCFMCDCVQLRHWAIYSRNRIKSKYAIRFMMCRSVSFNKFVSINANNEMCLWTINCRLSLVNKTEKSQLRHNNYISIEYWICELMIHFEHIREWVSKWCIFNFVFSSSSSIDEISSKRRTF